MEFLIAVFVAFGLGALHALEPSHGRAIVAAYLVGTRGTIRDAVILGIIVTITHFGTMIVLGLFAMAAAEHFVTEAVHGVFELISGLLILAVGIWMILPRFRQSREKSPDSDHSDHHHGHSHVHKSLDGEKLSLGQVIALGVSGGIVPCPAAFAVLIAAVSVAQFAKGIVLVFIFSLGAASALVTIGITMVKAADYVKDRASESKWIRFMPMVSAIVIILVGVVFILRAVYHIISGECSHH